MWHVACGMWHVAWKPQRPAFTATLSGNNTLQLSCPPAYQPIVDETCREVAVYIDMNIYRDPPNMHILVLMMCIVGPVHICVSILVMRLELYFVFKKLAVNEHTA
jgi:hypothetical protein